MSNPSTRKSCLVPNCKNTTINSPDKLFCMVPRDIEMRTKWMEAMKRLDPFGHKSAVYCCEDHFDIENDMQNYLKYKLVGGRIKLKPGTVPHKFKCQEEKEEEPYISAVQKYFEKPLSKDETWVLEKPEENQSSFGNNDQCLEIFKKKTPKEEGSDVFDRGINSELEKFKRRLIRVLTRMLIYEKRDEKDVWQGLQEQTGCDCQVLWSRMRALTIKKLSRLLDAQDCVELLPKGARMTVTDWLLCDMILVHQDHDLIGMTETTKEDRKVLTILFQLVEEHHIEFLAGDKLTEAWATVTLLYNTNGRQCSPMLLQRRWYQLKLSTRLRFYHFWSQYRGAMRKLDQAEVYKPTPLQTDIAKRYKQLVVQPFMYWEELVKHKLIVLPHDFEAKRSQVNPEEAEAEPEAEPEPEVTCIEPTVETIELDSNSDTEIENKKDVKIAKPVAIKQEPLDDMTFEEHEISQTRKEKISNFAEAVLQATSTELDEMDHADDKNEDLDTNSTDLNTNSVDLNTDTVDLAEKDIEILDTNDVEMDTEIPIPATSDQTMIEETTAEVVHQIDDEVIALDDTDDQDLTIIENKSDIVLVNDDDKNDNLDSINDKNDATKDPGVLLPKITSVFGGLNVNKDTLSKISLLTTEITKNIAKTTQERVNSPVDESNSSDILTELEIKEELSKDASNIASELKVKDEMTKDEKQSSIKSRLSFEPDSNLYGELSNDINFADDGIQFLDDGIAYQEDDYVDVVGDPETEIETIKVEDSPIPIDDDVPTVDQKLLMIPQINILKLEHMNILPLHLLTHIDSKTIIEMIEFKNSPIKEKVKEPTVVKKEIKELKPIQEKEEVKTVKEEIKETLIVKEEDSASDDDDVQEIKRVKLSSALLQKPRSRTYNPIQLCKNPDFNTRLRRLTVGFFSSSRNRLLLKECNPLTIDLSKAFENKLVNGTLYVNNDISDMPINVDKDNCQNVSVVPSSTAVGSLIENTSQITTDPNSPVHHKPETSYSRPCERNRVINLPDITEIRRNNQQLLIAEVTPLQVNNNRVDVPVSIVPSNNVTNSDNSTKRIKPGPASKTINLVQKPKPTNPMISILPEDIQLPSKTKVIDKPAVPWKPKKNYAESPWTKVNHTNYTSDTLLALDTLNKMLYLLTEDETNVATMKKTRVPKIPKSKKKDKTKSNKVSENDDVQIVEQTAPKSNKVVYKKKEYCCWARSRVSNKFNKVFATHSCPYPLCICCCKMELAQYFKESREKRVWNFNKRQKKRAAAAGVEFSPLNIDDVSNSSNEVNKIVDDSPVEVAGTSTEFPNVDKGVSGDNETDAAVEISKNVPTSDDDVISSDDNAMEIDTEASTSDNNDSFAEISLLPKKKSSSKQFNETSTNTDSEMMPPLAPAKIPRVRVLRGGKKIEHKTVTTKQVPIQQVPIQQAPINQVPIQQVPINHVPINQVPIKQVPINQIPIQQVPIQQVEIKQVEMPPLEPIATNPKGIPLSSIVVNAGAKPNDTDVSFKLTPNNTVNIPAIEIPNPGISIKILPAQKIPINPEIAPRPRHYSTSSRERSRGRRMLAKIQKDVLNIKAGPSLNNQNKIIPIAPTNTNSSSGDGKMIYLNSKNLSELPSDNPVLLGKNKILLTTATFPPNFKAFEAFQQEMKHSAFLPKSIRIELTPSGKVIYKSDMRAKIANEVLEVLPQLLAAIQLHIDSFVQVKLVQPPVANVQDEVIDLSDDETPEPKKVVNNVELTNQEIVKNVDISEVSQLSETISSVVENSSGALETEIHNNAAETMPEGNSSAVPPVTELCNANVEEGSAQDSESQVIQSISHNAETAESLASSVPTDNVTRLNSNDTEEANKCGTDTAIINSQETIDLSENGTGAPSKDAQTLSEKAETSESEKPKENKSKNILSDLMAMSGIEPLDIVCASEIVATPEVLETILQPTPQQSLSIINTDGANVAEVLNTSALYHNLTAITSLSELKYACAQNSKFFKLELETGALLPINVCMKRIYDVIKMPNNEKKAVHTKSVIDLTNDEVSVEESKITYANMNVYGPPKNLNATLDKPVNKIVNTSTVNKIVNTSNQSLLLSNNIGTFDAGKINRIKPLKLFKSGRREDTLKNKLKEIKTRITEAMKEQDILRRKRKRMQETKSGSSESSSDEEPLSKVALKMRSSEKVPENEQEIDLESAPLFQDLSTEDNIPDVNEPKGIESLTEEFLEDNVDLDDSMLSSNSTPKSSVDDEDFEVELEELDEALLEADDDDCILGV